VTWGFQKGKTYSAQAALSVFSRFCANEDIPLINTFGAFVEAAKSEKLFYDWDGHVRPEGHRVLADALVKDSEFLAGLR
jgi:lysophospholipase L1-like esterase